MQSVQFPVLRIIQPVGEFYIGLMSAPDLISVTYSDVRQIQIEREIESYLGIQRRLDQRRVDEIAKYVNTIDASFPSSVVLSVPSCCVNFDEESRNITLMSGVDVEGNEVPFGRIAKVLDGQHRIAGLEGLKTGAKFDVPVTIFVDADIATEAFIFATVNLAQTKVNRSLAIDLFEYAKSRSPQKTCHNIAVALDANEKSPFFRSIKRLGVATPGRMSETITQATFVSTLMPYISRDPVADRDRLMRGMEIAAVDAKDQTKLIFRSMFRSQRDIEIGKCVLNFFAAVKKKWPNAWDSKEKGMMLSKTNGFRALMRLLRPVYLTASKADSVLTMDAAFEIFDRVKLADDHFTTDEYPPGTSGESKLYRLLLELCELSAV
jgi:DGQHR domain-containing protein